MPPSTGFENPAITNRPLSSHQTRSIHPALTKVPRRFQRSSRTVTIDGHH
jgi:hypothetical protein